MDWNDLVGKKFIYQDETYEIIRLLSQQEDAVVGEVITSQKKKMILKIDVSQGDVFKSQIRIEQKIQEKLNLYDYFVFLINEKLLFEDKEIVYNPHYQEVFEQCKEKEYFLFENEEDESDLTSEDTNFVFAVLMPDLGKPISYELLYNQARDLNIDPEIFLENIFQQTLNFLDKLHEAGIFYADIKPANILFSTETNKITIIDYGISIESKNINCIEFFPPGTPDYVSPYIQYHWSFLNNKFRQKNKCFASLRDEYIGLYYTFLKVSGIDFPWSHESRKNILNNFYLYDESILKKYGNRSAETIQKVEKKEGFTLEHEKFWKWIMDEKNFFSIIHYSKNINGRKCTITDTNHLAFRNVSGKPEMSLLEGIEDVLYFYLKLKYSLPNYLPDYLNKFIREKRDFLEAENPALIDYISEEGITDFFLKELNVILPVSIR